EGKNITIEYRSAEQKPERLPELAADFVRLKVDVIVTTGDPAGLAAKGATSSIPIVMGKRWGPLRFWFRRQPRAARRKHYWILSTPCPGAKVEAGPRHMSLQHVLDSTSDPLLY